MDGVSDTVEHQAGWLLPDRDGSPRYFRLQLELAPGSGSMDDTSSAHITALEQAAAALIENQNEQLASLCSLLSADASATLVPHG